MRYQRARCYNHSGVASEDNRNVSPVVNTDLVPDTQ